ALVATSSRPRADQLVSLLAPHSAAAGEHPRRAGITVVPRPAHNGRVAVGRQRDGGALEDLVSNRASADQLVALLAPHPVAAADHPRRPNARRGTGRARIATRPTHDSGVAVGGQRDGVALLGASNHPGTDELAALLAPHPAAARKYPRRSDRKIVGIPA